MIGTIPRKIWNDVVLIKKERNKIMNAMPLEGTKVKVVGTILSAYQRIYQGDFNKINEWKVVGVGRTMLNGESMVNAKNEHGFLGGQICQFSKEELEEIV